MRAFLALAALSSLSAVVALNATVVNGVLTVPGSAPRNIGLTTSAISAAIASVFSGKSNDAVILKNASSFYDYIVVTGSYAADAPLALAPSLIVVLADATLTAQPSLSPKDAVVSAKSCPWSGVVGRGVARIVCPAGKDFPYAVYAGQSMGFVVDGLTIESCGSVHLEGLPFVTGGEVSNNVINNARERAIWTEKISRAVIHGNTISNATSHTIDFDAFSEYGLAYNNTVSLSRQEAVFIEQGATNIVVIDNDLGPGNAHGVSVYNNAIGSLTSGHVIARNRVWGCTSAGIGVGSTAPRSGAPSMNVLVAGEWWGVGGARSNCARPFLSR